MKIPEKYDNYKLCFADSSEYLGEPITLYFTELNDITKQWGDDWNDKPYEHNAGEPYEYDYSQPEQGVKNGTGIYPSIDIIKIIVNSAYNISTPRTGCENSPYSVEDINKGIVPWLTIENEDKSEFIKAGTTLKNTLRVLNKYRKTIDIFVELKED